MRVDSANPECLSFEFTFSGLARPIFSRPLLAIAPRWVFTALASQAVSPRAVMTSARINALWDFNHMEGTREATVLRFAAARSAVKDHLADIVTPTLILWGNEDRLVPVEAAREFNAAILNSKLVVYPGVGHMPQEEVPDESAAEARRFSFGNSRYWSRTRWQLVLLGLSK